VSGSAWLHGQMNHGKSHMKLRSRKTSLALALIAASFAFSPAYAQNHGGGHDNGGRDKGGHDGGGRDGGHDSFGRGNAPRMHMDGRYDHNHFYYDRGHVLHG